MRPAIHIAIGLLLIVSLATCGWLLVSDKGNRLLVEWSAGDQLKVSGFSGSLWSEMRLQSAEYRDRGQSVRIDDLRLRWRPRALLEGLLHVERLSAGAVSYAADGETQAQESDDFDPPPLPLALRFERIEVGSLKLDRAGESTRIGPIALSAESEQRRILLSAIDIRYLDHRLKADASLNLEQSLPFSADLSWQGKLPEVGPASASARLDGNLDAVNVELHGNAPLAVTGRGRLLLKEPQPLLEFQGQWRKLRWPLENRAEVVSDAGRFTLNGPLDRLALSTSAELGFPDTPVTTLQAQLRGELTPVGISGLLLDLALAENGARVSGELLWAPAVSWNLSLTSAALDTALLGEGWHGRIALDTELAGGISEQGVWTRLDLRQLSGTLLGHPLQASAKARYDKDGVQLEAARVTSGPNSLRASGRIAQRLQLQYTLDAPNLAASWPGLQGSLKADGQITGKAVDPEIKARVSANGFVYQQYQLAAVAAELVWRQAEAEGKVDITGFSLPGLHGRSLSLQVNGTPAQHGVEIDVDAEELRLFARARGNWQAPRWQGEIDRLELDNADSGRWQNSGPMKLVASAKRFRLDPSCLTQDRTKLCGEFQWQQGATEVSATLEQLPLERLLRPLAERARVEGGINARLQLQGPVDALRGDARIELKRGLLQVQADDGTVPLELRDGDIQISIAPERNRARLKLQAGEAAIQADLSAGSLAAGADARLQGSLDAEIPQLSQLSLLLPGLSDVQGRLDLRATLKGSFNRPEVTGLLELDDASALVPQLGLELRKVHFTARNRGSEHILLQGGVNSGEGRLDIEGELLLDQAKGWPLRLQARGEGIQLARLPEAEIIASPELEIRFAKGNLDVSGSVRVPQAEIEIRELPKQAVSVSDDAVIIGERIPSNEPESPLKIATRVDVILGNQVHFEGFGLNTRVQGRVALQGSAARNIAQGALSLEDGRYKAYGQDLTIERGRLLFNGPAHNPDLDIRATRLSLDEAVTAILNVSGNLRKPLVNIASEPSLPDSEALSYLLTGRGLNEKGPATITMLRLAAASKGLEKSQEILDRVATGVGVDEIRIREGATLEETSLLLGKYLSPDLYVSYAVGLFDNQGALTTRYRLSKRLRLEVQSGDAQSMDLIYDVEK